MSRNGFTIPRQPLRSGRPLAPGLTGILRIVAMFFGPTSQKQDLQRARAFQGFAQART